MDKLACLLRSRHLNRANSNVTSPTKYRCTILKAQNIARNPYQHHLQPSTYHPSERFYHSSGTILRKSYSEDDQERKCIEYERRLVVISDRPQRSIYHFYVYFIGYQYAVWQLTFLYIFRFHYQVTPLSGVHISDSGRSNPEVSLSLLAYFFFLIIDNGCSKRSCD